MASHLATLPSSALWAAFARALTMFEAIIIGAHHMLGPSRGNEMLPVGTPKKDDAQAWVIRNINIGSKIL